MNRKPHQERTFVILKPDTVQRGLVGEVIKRFERTGLKFTAMKMFVPTEAQLQIHYNKDEEWFLKKGNRIIEDLTAHNLPVDKEPIEYGRDIIRTIVSYMTAAPVIGVVLEGNQAVGVVTKLVGTTEPSSSDVGTIRGDYTVDSYGHSSFENRAVRNLIHCSESPEEAEREIALWFTENEVMDYVTAQERIMYDVNFDGKPE
ncbi:nucleoside-diphosphate kinase [Candidatus Parcubacteria bacterium]|uniref:nucleoside-diphosphate kinase n=1 Tax=Candidatus Kaiserbacteria bacterium CG10_big_fil_rev_8_21_14_0_10_47_16 TaxID=1974608 RepID=A0A2H0UDU1_9BACT|nr:nucleoside-diphosphate kinase [Candidatus Parcubacteria bacterium]PIR84593.1 MAG: nucleoside-diphosphate kinase [Candidatus Kaiserbacteria bacterium CG10_big_fil_rev_8_21_14_0_10_47_16]